MKIELQVFLNKLKERLTLPLPGRRAHSVMAPKVGSRLFRTFDPNPDASRSSVLLLLFGTSFERLEILLTLRSKGMQKHSHQISFPGGHNEADETAITTALREAKEEVGLDLNQIAIIGKLSDLFVPPSNTIITPVVAYAPEINNVSVNRKEVEEVFSVKLDFLMNTSSIVREIWEHEGERIEVPMWKVHPRVPLWGATAMILYELVEIIRDISN